MRDEGETVFPYRLQGPSTLLLTILIGIFGGLMLFMMRIEPDRFVGIYLGFPFGLLIYGALALVSLAICIRLMLAWSRQRGTDRAIFLTDTALHMPENVWSDRVVSINFRDIETIAFDNAARLPFSFIRVRCGLGNLRISDMGFETRADFLALHTALIAATKRAV
ncbi:hypothetical protein [uncultured Cohaesibacter sp.]|uniref:hypothetical protein n=1 Tax=uncultured Cohaesibacter sp. TaxID=1002546 RepID=UPI0029C93EE9|nr:hypothetical protein [uncultured Cohaesibacter sp.]